MDWSAGRRSGCSRAYARPVSSRRSGISRTARTAAFSRMPPRRTSPASHCQTGARRAWQAATPRRAAAMASTACAREGRWNSPAPRKARIASGLRSSPAVMAWPAVACQVWHVPARCLRGPAEAGFPGRKTLRDAAADAIATRADDLSADILKLVVIQIAACRFLPARHHGTPFQAGALPGSPALVLRRTRDRAALRRRPDGEPAKFRSHLLASSSRARRCPFLSLRIVLLIAVYFKLRFASPYS